MFEFSKIFSSILNSSLFTAFFNSSIILITGLKLSCPNFTAFNICSSVNPDVSTQPLKLHLLFPQLLILEKIFEAFLLLGSKQNHYQYSQLEAATGPKKGKPDILSAAELAINDNTSGSFSLS